MKKNLILLLILILCYLLQSSVFAFLPLGNVTPDILIAAVVSFSLMYGSREGLWLGFWAGLILDLFYGPHIGMYALIYMYVGYLNGLFRRFGYAEELKFPIFMVAVSEFFINLVTCFFTFYFRGKTNLLYYLRTIILPKTVYTTALAAVLCFVFLQIYRYLEKHTERGQTELDL